MIPIKSPTLLETDQSKDERPLDLSLNMNKTCTITVSMIVKFEKTTLIKNSGDALNPKSSSNVTLVQVAVA